MAFVIGLVLSFILFIVLGALIPVKMYCRMGLHKWDMPGGHCEDCGICDEFFEPHKNCEMNGKKTENN